MGKLELNNLGIAPLAGICSYEDAGRVGYAVDHSVNLLKRYIYIVSRCNEIFASYVAPTPEWEVKCALSLHTWLDAEHSAALRKRVAEMREPPLHLDKVPEPHLQACLDEVIRANNTLELLVGVYRVVKPALAQAWKHYLHEANPIADHPTYRLLKLLLGEQQEMIAWGEQAIVALTQTEEDHATAAAWENHLQAFLQAAGGVAGDLAQPEGITLPSPRSDGQPYTVNVVPQRDQRFADPFNRQFYFRDTSTNEDDAAYVLLCSRLREMDVPEWIGPIIAKTKGKPWEYYVDLSRQLWDEARHAMMGEVGLYHEGMPFYAYPVELHASMALNTEFEPRDAHIILWGIEQALMPRKTGKAREVELARATGNALLVTFQDYDWADEVLHAQIGRRWLVAEAGGMEQLRAAFSPLNQQWFESMTKLDARSPQTPWWPTFLVDIRQRRAQREVADATAH